MPFQPKDRKPLRGVEVSVVRLAGACCGLLVFSGIIVCGLAAGNPPELIIYRAVIGLLAGFVLGAVLGAVAMTVAREGVHAEPQTDTASADAPPPSGAASVSTDEPSAAAS